MCSRQSNEDSDMGRRNSTAVGSRRDQIGKRISTGKFSLNCYEERIVSNHFQRIEKDIKNTQLFYGLI
jgi:hypothetical protein